MIDTDWVDWSSIAFLDTLKVGDSVTRMSRSNEFSEWSREAATVTKVSDRYVYLEYVNGRDNWNRKTGFLGAFVGNIARHFKLEKLGD